MQGFTSAYESSRLAIEMGKTDDLEDKQLVLFVFLMHNYNQFKSTQAQSFRMNDSKYSAHYQEREVLMAEGTPMVVLDVEEVPMVQDRFDKRTSIFGSFMGDGCGKSLTVVYLFNTHLA